MKKINVLKISLFCMSTLLICLPLNSCSNGNLILRSKALPMLKSYEQISMAKYQINKNTRFVITEDMYEGEQNIRDFFYNLAAIYFDKMQEHQRSLANVIPIVVGNTSDYHIQDGDIIFNFTDHFSNDKYDFLNSSTVANQAYQIKVNRHIEIFVLANNNQSLSIQGFYNAAMSLLQLQFTNNGINYGIITDWPKVNQRGIYFDCSGRGYSSQFIDQLIRELAWNKLNTIGLRFASGGCHINTHKDTASNSHDGTWFTCDWTRYPATNPRPSNLGDSFLDDYDICQNYADHTPTWDWNGPHSEFGKLLTLAKLNGVELLPEMNVFLHGWFITDLTCPKNADGTRKETGFTDAEKEWDFAVYDDSGKRLDDAVDLSGSKLGSKVAMDLIYDVLDYFSTLFKNEGINNFGIGGDEYIENFRWHATNLSPARKQAFVDGYYDFTNRLDAMLMDKGMNSQQWNDDLFRNIRNQDLADDYGFPATSQANNDKIIRTRNNQFKTIKYWWKGDIANMNPIATIDDLINGANSLGGGIQSLINYDYWNLYFCDDTHSVRIPKAKTLYKSWDPGVFSKNHELPNSPYQIYSDANNGMYPNWIHGAMMSVWWDWAPWTMTTIYGPLKAFAQKCWNGTDKLIKFSQFEKIVNILGHGI